MTPSQLFSGELARIRPHVVSASGCVKGEYAGPRKYLRVSTEIWEDGESRPAGSLTTSVSFSKPDEVSVTLHDIAEYTDELAYRMVVRVGSGGSTTRHLGKFDTSDLFGVGLQIQGPVEIPDGQEEIIWGYAWKHGDVWRGDLPLEEQVRTAKWAVVLKLKMLGETD